MSDKFRIDPSLVTSWSLHLSEEEPYEYPFKAHYRAGKRELTYIASLHSCETDSPTFELITSVIENRKIDLLILEGITHSLGASPENLVTWAKKQAASGIYEGFETALAIALADQKKIPFVGGEPDERFVLSRIIDAGFTAKDLLYYSYAQQLYQQGESRSGSESDPAVQFESFVQKNALAKLEKSLSFSDFRNWYLEKNGRPFAVSDVDAEVLAPFGSGELFTQKISSAVCRIRDQFVITLIERSFNTHDSLLVIYGGSHWSTQKKSLEDAFGPPSFSI